MSNHSTDKTVTVLLTGRGRGAVATVLLYGVDAERIVAQRFEPISRSTSVTDLQLNKPYFGNWRWDEYDEELVVCRTDTQTFEVHCHGGNVASETILESIEAGGATRQTPAEWLRDSVTDKFEAVALEQLPHATTPRIAAVMLDQTRGVLRTSLAQIQRELSDDDLAPAKAKLTRLIELGHIGVRLNQPFTVVLIGPPNTGKSSLINALVGFERSIVFDLPGTTRDLVRAETAIDGWPIQFVDTAGVRETDDAIEKEGVRLAQQVVQTCDLALIVCDLTDNRTQPTDLGLPNDLRELRVGTKADLACEASTETLALITSAETGQGIESLLSAIATRLVPNPPKPGEALPLDQETLSLLVAVAQLLDAPNDEALSQAKQTIEQLLS